MKFTLILLLSHRECFTLWKYNFNDNEIIVASLVFAGIVSEIAGFVQNGITLSQNAISHHGGTFTDLFGADQSNIASVPSDSDEFVDVDLRMDNFLITGIDPFFDASRDVFFVLYTNENNEGEIFSIENVGNTTFNKSNPVRVIIHGLNNNYTSPMSQTVMKAYLEEGDYNVVSINIIDFPIFMHIFFEIVTDWSLGANDRFYLHSRLRVDSVSGQVAGIINSLIARNFTTYDQVVIVGHSLGLDNNNSYFFQLKYYCLKVDKRRAWLERKLLVEKLVQSLLWIQVYFFENVFLSFIWFYPSWSTVPTCAFKMWS